MEAWQYSALNAQFATLQRQLLSTVPSFKSNSHLHQNDCFDEPMSHDPYNDAVKSGVKRKAEDVLKLEGVKYQRVGSSKKCDTSSLLMLDMYTQTESSFLQEHNRNSSQVIDLVQANHDRLERLERLLECLVGEKKESQLAQGPALRGRRKPSKLDIQHVLPAESEETADLQVLEFPMYSPPQSHKAVAAGSEHEPSPSVDSTRSPPATSPAPSHGSRVSFGEPAVHVSDWPSTSTQALDSAARLGPRAGALDTDPRAIVPVIIAPLTKGRTSITVEVPLSEILSGAAPAIEDVEQSSYAHGCWLGDKSDPSSRSWYCGDPKVIQRAESSGTNPAKLSLNLLEALFIREEMAASNVNGARGRELLNPIKINAIQAHINFKFPLEPIKQERRWQYIKPRIDSKCRAQRRLQREQQARLDSASMTSRSRSFNTRMVVDHREKEVLLYGFSKSDMEQAYQPDGMSELLPGSERHVTKQSKF